MENKHKLLMVAVMGLMVTFHLSTAYFGAEAAGMSTHLTILLMIGMVGMMGGMMYFMHGKGSGHDGHNCCGHEHGEGHSNHQDSSSSDSEGKTIDSSCDGNKESSSSSA